MTARRARFSVSNLAAVFLIGLLAGCGDDGDSSLTNNNPGLNDLNVVVAFGDSITQGSECSCVPYPARLAGLIGKVVCNTGVGGSNASANVDRTQQAINKYHPAFMIILYGVNDVIHGDATEGIAAALAQMVLICKQNNVVPVLMTYPRPILGHNLFAGGTVSLNRSIRAL
ncbi:MAG TPA: SGNH/GDSL hydrolase family protein, partial [Kiritimatiellia bacterium]|nr:SGNH/GDSL hydrolase family protein [Kiritimatiellia bacterium]